MNKTEKIERLHEKKLHNEIRKKIETLSLRSRVTAGEEYYRRKADGFPCDSWRIILQKKNRRISM
jgi:hypothetical protein